MGFFDFLKQPDIDQGLEACRATPSAVLLDVRTPEEYAEGHIPGGRNVPLQRLDAVESAVKSKDTPLFVYCLSGARSRQAVSMLRSRGYTNVQNIGGISAYSGKVEK